MSITERQVPPLFDIYSAFNRKGNELTPAVRLYAQRVHAQVLARIAPYGATSLADLASVIQRGLLPSDEADALANLAAKLQSALESGRIPRGADWKNLTGLHEFHLPIVDRLGGVLSDGGVAITYVPQLPPRSPVRVYAAVVYPDTGVVKQVPGWDVQHAPKGVLGITPKDEVILKSQTLQLWDVQRNTLTPVAQQYLHKNNVMRFNKPTNELIIMDSDNPTNGARYNVSTFEGRWIGFPGGHDKIYGFLPGGVMVAGRDTNDALDIINEKGETLYTQPYEVPGMQNAIVLSGGVVFIDNNKVYYLHNDTPKTLTLLDISSFLTPNVGSFTVVDNPQNSDELMIVLPYTRHNVGLMVVDSVTGRTEQTYPYGGKHLVVAPDGKIVMADKRDILVLG